MSTAPWGTMNGWLRIEGEQRGAWLARRVQDVRASQVGRRPASESVVTARPLTARPVTARPVPQPEPTPAASVHTIGVHAPVPVAAEACTCAEVA